MMTNLAMMLKAYQQKHDITGRDMALIIGIDKSTFCRIGQGKLPDAKNLAKIISWMIEESAS